MPSYQDRVCAELFGKACFHLCTNPFAAFNTWNRNRSHSGWRRDSKYFELVYDKVQNEPACTSLHL